MALKNLVFVFHGVYSLQCSFLLEKKNTIKTKNEAKVGQKERLDFLLEVLRQTQIMHFESTVPICELTCSYRFSENLILTPPIPKQNFLLSSFVDIFIFIPFIYYFPEFLQSFWFWPPVSLRLCWLSMVN